MIETDLVLAAKAGDRDSFAKLYSALEKELYKYALYALGNVQDAEDAVAETFLECYRGIGSLREPASFKAWTYRILSVRIKRKIGGLIQKRNQLNIDDFIADENLSVPGGEGLAIQRTDLLDALAQLKAEERMIVVLWSVEGYTTREIAEVLGLPHGTVSSKLHRTLIKMRNYMERE